MKSIAPRGRLRTPALVFVIAVLSLASFIPVTALGQKAKGTLDAPIMACGISSASSIEIQVCAGPSGAPAGFSVQWQTLEDYNQYGWPGDSSCPLDLLGNPTCGASFCKASFSGNANGSSYNLAAGQCTVVQIGDNLFDDPGASSNCASTPLQCGTTYVFRAFAHAISTKFRSAFTSNLECATISCVGANCTFTQGYWKTHYPDNWPADVIANGLTIGTATYTAAELEAIFNKPPSGGNGLISLAHQLIAVKLNIANGADGSAVTLAIAGADTLIGGLIIPPVGPGFLPASTTSSLTAVLDSYNNGLTGPGHCED